jgi:hypothetical protein
MARARPSLPRQIRLLIALIVAVTIAFAITTQFSSSVLSADSSVDTSLFVKESNPDGGKPMDADAPIGALLVIAILASTVSCSLFNNSRDLIPSTLVSFVNAPPRAPPLLPLL